jgi:hypothetical protein
MDTTIVASVLTWLEGHPAFAETDQQALVPVTLEELPTDGTAGAMLSTLTGDPYLKRYKDGGYVALYPFQVILRIPGEDTQLRIDAMATLGDIATSIDDRNTWPVAPEGYSYQTFSVRTSPVPIGVDDSGTRDYQATFELTYRKRG